MPADGHKLAPDMRYRRRGVHGTVHCRLDLRASCEWVVRKLVTQSLGASGSLEGCRCSSSHSQYPHPSVALPLEDRVAWFPADPSYRQSERSLF